MAHMLVMVILSLCLLFAWQRFRDVLTYGMELYEKKKKIRTS